MNVLGARAGGDDRGIPTPALAIIAAGTFVRLLMAWRLPLVADEAYYWTWAQRLAGGYFDHPPMIAWLIRVGTAVFGDSPFGVRFVPVLAGGIAILGTTGIAARVAVGRQTAVLVATAMTLIPLAAAGLVLATPDAPLLAAYSVSLYSVIRALESDRRSDESLRWWLIAGWALGFAALSKYTAVLLPAGVFISMLAHRHLRPRLLEPGPYLAALLAAGMFVPALAWNARHDWVSFTFQLSHGLGAPVAWSLRSIVSREGDLLGGQLALASPVLFVFMAAAVGRALRPGLDGTRFMLAALSAFVFLFFVYSALHKRVEANWLAPAYVGAIVLVFSQTWGTRASRWLRTGFTVAAVMSTIIYLHALVAVLPIPPARDPVGRAFGWDELSRAAVLAAEEAHVEPGVTSWLAADRYQDASQIAFHAGLGRDVFALNLTGRRNQFDLWPAFVTRARVGDRLVFAVDETAEPHEAVMKLSPHFVSILRGELVEMRRGADVVGRRRIYSLDGWTGGWPR